MISLLLVETHNKFNFLLCGRLFLNLNKEVEDTLELASATQHRGQIFFNFITSAWSNSPFGIVT